MHGQPVWQRDLRHVAHIVDSHPISVGTVAEHLGVEPALAKWRQTDLDVPRRPARQGSDVPVTARAPGRDDVLFDLRAEDYRLVPHRRRLRQEGEALRLAEVTVPSGCTGPARPSGPFQDSPRDQTPCSPPSRRSATLPAPGKMRTVRPRCLRGAASHEAVPDATAGWSFVASSSPVPSSAPTTSAAPTCCIRFIVAPWARAGCETAPSYSLHPRRQGDSRVKTLTLDPADGRKCLCRPVIRPLLNLMCGPDHVSCRARQFGQRTG